MTGDLQQELMAQTDKLGTRSRLLAASVRLFQSKGYSGVGISEILAETKLPKGSLYHHFPGGKEELALEAVRFIAAEVSHALQAKMGKGKRAGTLLVEFAQDCASWMIATQFAQTPLLSQLANDNAGPALKAEVAHAYDIWREQLASALERQEDSRDKATLALAVLEGGIVLARVRQDCEPLIKAATLAALMINRRD